MLHELEKRQHVLDICTTNLRIYWQSGNTKNKTKTKKSFHFICNFYMSPNTSIQKSYHDIYDIPSLKKVS